jgi:hypothetical protein
MSCGCGGTKDSIDSVNEQQPEFRKYQLPNETIECFTARIGGDPVPPDNTAPTDKIETQSIIINCELKTDTTFKMTKDSKPVNWSDLVIKDDQGNIITDTGLTYTNPADNDTSTLKGTVDSKYNGKKLHGHIKAFAQADNAELNIHAGDIVDEKEYQIVVAKCDPTDLRFINPNPTGVKTSGFGPRPDHFHKGIDLSSGGRADIIAAADGIVSFSGVQNGYGNCVEIQHKDPSGKVLASTMYGHLARIYVHSGEQVAAGTKLGREGNSGISRGAHLHFEIRLQGKKGMEVDPLPYISGRVLVDSGNTVTDGQTYSPGTNPDPGVTSGQTTIQNNKNTALTKEKIDAGTDCPPSSPTDKPAAARDKTAAVGPPKNYHNGNCAPAGYKPPPASETAQKIIDTLNAHGITDQQDQRYFLTIAMIEGLYNPYAKCGIPESTAYGLYQMNDDTAARYFGEVGIPLTCENRSDVEKSTIAAIAMFNREEKPNAVKYLANPSSVHQNQYTATYASMPKAELYYMTHGQGGAGFRKGTSGVGDFMRAWDRGSNFYGNAITSNDYITKLRNSKWG